VVTATGKAHVVGLSFVISRFELDRFRTSMPQLFVKLVTTDKRSLAKAGPGAGERSDSVPLRQRCDPKEFSISKCDS